MGPAEFTAFSSNINGSCASASPHPGQPLSTPGDRNTTDIIGVHIRKTGGLKHGKKRIHGTIIPDRNAVHIDIWLGIQVNGVHTPDHQQWCSTGTSAFYSLDAGLSGKQLAKRDSITSPGQFLLYKFQGVVRGFFGLLDNLDRLRPILRHEVSFQGAA